MDLDMDDYMDPYEEAEAAAGPAGVAGPATEDSSDDPDEDDSDSERDYEEKSYGLLMSGNHRVRNPDGTFRCPFCPCKKKQGYKLKDLLQHADGIGASTKHSRHGRERAFHRAFARFVRTDPSFADELAGITGIPGAITPATANANGSASDNRKAKANVDTARSSSVAVNVGPPQEVEKFAWPWTCVLAAGAGFNPEGFADRVAMFSLVEVVPLFVDEVGGTESFALVRFTNDWSGFNDALTLENHFSVNKLGKKEWETRNSGGGAVEGEDNKCEVKIYGWVARQGDYNAASVVGRFLRKHTNLKTIDEVSKIELESSGKMVAILASQIEAKNQYLQHLETKKNATEFSIARLEKDNRKLHEVYIEEMRNLHRRACENALRIFQDNENLRLELENKRKELNSRAKQLEKLSAENASDRKKLNDEKQKAKDDNCELELASIEQQRADEDVLKLLDDQKREKDVLARMLQLEKELHEKQQLELEVTRLNGTLQVMKHLEGDDDGDIHEKMEKLSKRLEHERKRLEELSGDLVTKERESNNELQQARKELILGLEDELNGRTAIGVKRMGELDEKPFQNACRKKFGSDDYQTTAAELVSHWQEELKKPSWHPFKMITQADGENKEVINDDDAKLKFLWIEYGDCVQCGEDRPDGDKRVQPQWTVCRARSLELQERPEGDNEGGAEVSVRADGDDDQA